ncbi:alpha-L-fucosidase (plasmid) [Fulvitalea axinellae]|uniref:alpha-L-fucosidase n=1 Tax=Fulvitalea axinellae TaxID=1182444 RepID=A0AAU9DNG5_9BACT|nr:alpha-L-fucosidase [Fulvitalea axinellae]
MKKTALLLALFLSATVLRAQKVYKPDHADLDTRPLPAWFGQAKFGIFIHWGPYSVPAWSPKGTYEEWYQYWLQTEGIFGNGDFSGKEIPDMQSKLYGESSSYYDFGRQFKAELYDPAQWAKLFKKAGAKYVILTSKHHDGFTLWPNKEAGNARNFKWNSVDIGAKRDLVGDYMKAMRSEGLKAGLYFSLLEWYHPWSRQGMFDKFVDRHIHPQFKDLVTRYSPDLIYADGEWGHSAKEWKSEELLAWLYNESSAKDHVIVNDRWGRGDRHKHGGYYTTEYEVHGVKGDHPWEEIRGMGLSFGYNRMEDLEDYNSSKTLILMLADIVSRGGNLCLNIGPRADGKIPVIMQERLTQIGAWLSVNGEAIYGTKKWSTPIQWSKGSRDFDFKAGGKKYIEGDYILKQTVDPIPGKAVKEVFFTSKGDALYAIIPKWRKGKVTLKNVTVAQGAKVTLLGADKKAKFRQSGKNLVIDMPDFDPEWNLPPEAYVIKISKVRRQKNTI